MNKIVELLIKKSLDYKCFVHYNIGGEVVEYPFQYQNSSNNVIKGIDYIFNKPIKLEESKITGFSEYNEANEEHFIKRAAFLKARYEAIQVLLNDYKFVYNYDLDRVIYSVNPDSTFLIAFNAENSEYLRNKDATISAKNIFKLTVQIAVERAKRVIMSEIESYRAENQESESEINMILDILNDVVENLDLNQESPLDLITNSWPALLAPNPFMVYS